MNDQQLNQALTIAAQNSQELAELVKFANGANFNCPDARKAAAIAGEFLHAKGANESTIIQSMGQTYEAVLFTEMHKAGRINPPNQTYANRITEVYNQVVRMINSLQQDQGRTQGNGTGIFTTGSNNGTSGLFTKQDSGSSAGLFTKQDSSSGTSGLFTGGKKDEPLFASSKQEEPASSLFGNAGAEDNAEPASAGAPTTVKGINSMEALIAHETEAALRKTCVTARQVTESIALYKDANLGEAVFADGSDECTITVGRRTPVQIACVKHSRNFEIGENEKTQKVLDQLADEVVSFGNAVEELQDKDFSVKMVNKIITTAIGLHNAFDAYASTCRESNDLETLTVTDATRASNAVTTELYRAMAIAIDFAAEDKGFPNADGNAYVHFELDFSNFKEEAEQLEEFYLSYDGKQANVFELLFCQFARALSWIHLMLSDNNLQVGKREIRIELPYPLFDNVEIGGHHALLSRDVMGENLDLLSDLTDVVEKRFPAARVFVIDGLYRTGYVDRAYTTCRPKIVLQ